MTRSDAEQAISQEKYVSMATFRRPGWRSQRRPDRPVRRRPGRVLTSSASGKAKRLRNNPSVTLQPSDAEAG